VGTCIEGHITAFSVSSTSCIMATKRPSEDDPNVINKIQRIEHAESTTSAHRLSNNDFSGTVKKKLTDSKRTGQACDRCKVRTMRQYAPEVT
jgi:hypothetical protein